jgi:hypothetical protein
MEVMMRANNALNELISSSMPTKAVVEEKTTLKDPWRLTCCNNTAASTAVTAVIPVASQATSRARSWINGKIAALINGSNK